MSEIKQPGQKLVDVVLAKAHTHAGKPYPAGSTIKVSEPDRDWLQANQVIHTTSTKETTK